MVEELASAVAMSRTTFTERFKALVGLPPLNYLIRWRMAVASTALRTGEKSLSTVAESVGYGSDTAFNSAFKRTTGRSPGRYRSAQNRSQEADRAEIRERFANDAALSEGEAMESGKAFTLEAAFDYLEARAAGKAVRRPGARTWRASR